MRPLKAASADRVSDFGDCHVTLAGGIRLMVKTRSHEIQPSKMQRTRRNLKGRGSRGDVPLIARLK